MDPTWHATDSDDWEHVLSPDGPPSRRPSLPVNHTSARPWHGGLQHDISFFDLMYDHIQTENRQSINALSPSQMRDAICDAVSEPRIAVTSDAPVRPLTLTDVNSSIGQEHFEEIGELRRRKPREPSMIIDASPERPKSPETEHHPDPDSPRSIASHRVETSGLEVPLLSPSLLDRSILQDKLADLPITIVNPRREDWKDPVPVRVTQKARDERYPGLLLQPDSRPISQQQLASEIKSIYAGLAMVENKSIHFDHLQAADSNTSDHFQALVALHRTLLHEHHDFFLASQHPSASLTLRGLAAHHVQSNDSYYDSLLGAIKKLESATLYNTLNKYIMTDTNLIKRYSDHVIPGLLDSQHNVDATGDTAAKYNFMNEDYAKGCKFKIDPTSRTLITIASGQKVMTTGIAEVSFSFRGEQTPYPLKFHILPGCIKNVILGKSFLKATKTFSNALHFAKRVVKRFTRTLNTHQVLFLGASPPMFAGLLNGETKTALADSASKVLIMDEDYARTLGLSIVSTKKTCIKLRFADGSTAFTSGKTYNVSWQFGTGKRYPLNFYILKNAPADVILSEEFLLRETRAFIEYADCLMEEDGDDDIGYYDDSDEDDYFFAIDRDENYHPQAYSEGADQYFEDDREDARRTEEDLHISSLTGDEKEAAIARAKERRKQWAEKQAANSLAQGSQPSTTNTASLSAAPQPHTSNATGVPSTSKRQRWQFKLMKKRKSGKTGQNP